MKSLDEILALWVAAETRIRFHHLALDSRDVTPGDLFCAVVGHQQDGRRFIDSAVAQGAVAVLCEAEHDARLADRIGPEGQAVPVIGLKGLNARLSALALRAYPDAGLPRLIGVTGTNGKTTVTQLIAQLLTALGQRTGVMGTVGNGLWGATSPSVNTTSDAVTVARSIADMAKQGAGTVAMEISSHGLSQQRVAALPIALGVFTNLSRDHLDYHGDMQSYAEAKRALFEMRSLNAAVLNLDDEYGIRWYSELQGRLRVLGYSVDGAHCEGDRLQLSDIRYQSDGVRARLDSSFGQGELHSPLLGKFNLANLLAALGALLLQGYPLAELLAVVPKLAPAPGRMECFHPDTGPGLVVDYAHTPDALEQALQALRQHCEGQLWCVFGCGGERDRGKRPIMAQSAEHYADRLVITADNPRSERFEDIVADMMPGLKRPGAATVIAERAEAVRFAFTQARPEDLILLAGKGHEDYQLLAGERLSYDERALARSLAQAPDGVDGSKSMERF
ncbi:UDP-N-acetylmuramoyl-L-alanyl-D-glutamate--2,6-diaminopimelate ligase [Ferrimonas gelatinilytica]|uniref:UDP-N-acetylmuramoyl-L-alanyl-D-glutamate--2,6-diaminopimelate ligase n=1 Tax=Ferrimonas gelatinilytica TaxID=1255257 RepID=A0ABP9SFH8_9GAMM